MVAVALTIAAWLCLAIGDVATHVDTPVLPALHILNAEFFYPITVGASAFLLGGGAAVLQSRYFRDGSAGWASCPAS